jgi:putative oxidoreductase
VFIAHAGMKYFVLTLPGTAQLFRSLGLPAALALIAILVGATWAHAGWEYPAFLIVAAAAQALLGNGAYALVNRGHAHKLREEAYT